jgi:hypothetical protein
MSFQIPMNYYKTSPLYATIERRGMNESKHLLKSEMDLKDLGKKLIHSNYTTEAIAYNNAWPLLINFDAGGDLMASILGMFSYTDISIVNVKDPGDSLRNRNKILTAIEKISNKYPTLIGAVFLEDFKKVNRIQPDSPKGAWAFIEACRGVSGLNINNGLFIDYVVKTYTAEMAKSNGMLPTTKEAIQASYTDYVKRKFKKIMRDEKYVIHNKNVRFIITGTASTAEADAATTGSMREVEIKLLDVEYYFGKDRNQMRIKFHPADVPLNGRDYDRENINSASDVGKNIHTQQAMLTNIVKLMGSSGNPRTLFEVLQKTPEESKKKPMLVACMRVYLECMYKFIGDFCQILYSFYLGSIFGSFDRSAVAVAFFVMRTLTENKEAYKRLKNYKADDAASVERIRRGLVIATSATYHGRKAPSVSFYMNYDAMNNVETGKTIMKKFITKRMLAVSKQASKTLLEAQQLQQLQQLQLQAKPSEGILDIERIFTLRKEYIHRQMRKYIRHLNTYYLDSDYLPESLQGAQKYSERSERSEQASSAYQSLQVEQRRSHLRSPSPTQQRIQLKKKKGSLLQRVQEQTRQTMKEWMDATLKELEQTSESQPVAITYVITGKPGKAAKAAKAPQETNIILQGLILQSPETLRAIYERRLKERDFLDKNNYLWNRLNAKIKMVNEQIIESHTALLVKLMQQPENNVNKIALDILRKRLTDAPLEIVSRELRSQYGLKNPPGEPEPMDVDIQARQQAAKRPRK